MEGDIAPKLEQREDANALQSAIYLDDSLINNAQGGSYNHHRFEDILSFIAPYNSKMPIESFFRTYDEVSRLFQLTPIQRIAFCRKLLTGEIEMFLNSRPLSKTYEELKEDLVKEFGTRINIAEIHGQLAKERKHKEESHITFYYRMLQIAAPANLDEEALKHYIINGICAEKAIDLQLRNTRGKEELKNLLKQIDRQQRTDGSGNPSFDVPRVPMRRPTQLQFGVRHSSPREQYGREFTPNFRPPRPGSNYRDSGPLHRFRPASFQPPRGSLRANAPPFYPQYRSRFIPAQNHAVTPPRRANE